MKSQKLMIIITILLLITACSNNHNKKDPLKASYNGMGTIADFIIFGEETLAAEGFEKAKKIMIDIENKMSLNIEDSEINKINLQAGKDKVVVSEDTFNVISRGLYFSELTNGSYDISIGPITKLWNIGKNDERVPSNEEIIEKLPLVDYNKIIVDIEEKSVFLEKEGMELDLGSIAKGYAADKIISTFKDMGIENALINIGGNIKVLGKNPQRNRSWMVGLRNPRDARGSHFATIKLDSGKTVVTSGDYERFFIKEGIRYHHIFDGNIGRPSKSDIIGVSIIAENSIDADGLSTSVFLLGSKKGLNLIEQMDSVEAVLVTKNLKLITTKGAEGFIEEMKNQL